MNLPRVLACSVGLVALVLPLYVYAEYIYLLGFPDGYITALGAAERKLALVFIGSSLVLGSYLIYLGLIAGRRKMGARLVVAVGLYLLVLVGTAVVDYYYHGHLDGGGGG